ncbi:MAG: helix-turn-helix domain-containing protein [Gammaproteobacteria bacterium]|nr:helix-turn-helix domain-containing protein [Gammaproteobacteria bacterium]
MPIGERLKEERNRLGLNQTDFGKLCCVTRQTQRLYEKGERTPDSKYLAAIAKVGADILYIVTGERNAVSVRRLEGGEERLKPDEAVLLDNYRHLSGRNREIIQKTSAALAQREQDEVNPQSARQEAIRI